VIARSAVLAAVVLGLLPATAGAHALLERTMPDRGAALQSPPEQVAFFFSEPVEASFGAVRVFNADGEQAETGEIIRPEGRSDAVAVSVDPELPDGTYTATYRVISADSHPVSGGFVFTVGKAGAGPAETVSELLDDTDAGAVTSVAYWAARWLGYAAIGLAVGLLGFLLIAWWPALRRVGGAGKDWARASESFATRTRTLLLGAALTGLVCSAVAVVLQAATAAGTSFWSVLDPDSVGEVLETRFGLLTGLRTVAWALVVAVVLVPTTSVVPRLREVRLGATGAVVGGRRPGLAFGALALPVAFLLISPALAGHAATQDPSWVLIPANVVHITAMSLWFGGLAALALAVPAATRALEPADKGRLLAATLLRFSPLALGCVIALVAGGVIQGIVYIGPLSDLVETAFGRAVLIKAALLLALVSLGAVNRQRLVPALRRLADRGERLGRAGLLLRRTLRAEVALIVVVLGVTAALVSYAPPGGATAGPASGSLELGPASLEYTVDPAEVGRNEMHLYLFDAVDGTQFTEAKELRVDLALPEKQIGPIEAELRRAGPGHYVAPGNPFGVAGEWTADVTLRLSRFEQEEASFEVAIR
jgi:copper transport protein